MTGSATSGIGGPEPDQYSAQDHRDKSFECEQRRPREYFARRQSGEIVDAQFRQRDPGLLRDCDVLRTSPVRSEEASHQDADDEKEIPKAGSLPVVTKVIKLAGQDSRTQMPQATRHSKHLVIHD